MTAPGLLPEGLRDRLPPHADALARLVWRALDVAQSWGYERVSPPLAEFEDTLVGRLKSSRPQDLLRVIDPVSQRTLALRPDITAQVGRIAVTRMAHRARPLRLAYGGPVLKLKATQLRPEREMMQVGAEIIGTDNVAAAREIVGLALAALERAGVTGITLDITLPDLVDTLSAGPFPIEAGKSEQVRALLDAKDAGGLAALGADLYLPLIDAAGPFPQALDTLRAIDAGGALASRIAAIEAITEAIAGKAALTLDPTERHGFEYQSWFGFSLFATGVPGEIGRGGSYTVLHPDGREEPAVGFSLYPDPLIDAGLGGKPRRRIFVPAGADPVVVEALRADGWSTVAALGPDDDAVALGCDHRLVDGAVAAA